MTFNQVVPFKIAASSEETYYKNGANEYFKRNSVKGPEGSSPKS